MIQLGFQAKHLERNTGGNATYARRILEGLRLRDDVDVSVFASGVGVGRLREVRRMALESAPDLVNRHSRAALLHYTGDTGPLLRPTGCKLVTTVHGYAQGHIPGVRRPVHAAAWRLRVQRAIAVSTRLITVSRSSADDLVRYLGANSDRIDVIYSGIDHEQFNPRASGNLASIRVELGRPFVLYIGNLEPRKNLTRAIAAFTKSSLPSRGWQFVIAGRAAWLAEPSLRSIRSAGASVRYLGEVPAELVAPLMAAAQAFFFPSLYEGFGFPPLEAMACGTPVIVSARGALGEVTAGCGMVVDPLSIDDMARALDRVCLTRLADEMVQQGLDLVRRYTWPRSVEAHVESYRAAIA